MKDLHEQVRQDYRQILLDPQNSVLTGDADGRTVSASVGYTPEELALVPGEANLGLGCGNPLRPAYCEGEPDPQCGIPAGGDRESACGGQFC